VPRLLFIDGLRLCREAGLVELGHVALDGTKIKANASKHKAMSYSRMKEAEPALTKTVEAWMSQARGADDDDDDTHGPDRRGDETPEWMASKEARLAKIRDAKAALEADAEAGPYHLRKITVEPVFGQIKQARGFRQFLMRGLANVQAEWAMICTAHNLCKLAAAR
jgi:Transposase DDE domain